MIDKITLAQLQRELVVQKLTIHSLEMPAYIVFATVNNKVYKLHNEDKSVYMPRSFEKIRLDLQAVNVSEMELIHNRAYDEMIAMAPTCDDNAQRLPRFSMGML